MMDSIVKEALARAEGGVGDKKVAREEIGDPAVIEANQELEELLKGLKTTIEVMGCGGSGCNTVDRMEEEGIKGATLTALNTDAQHLLIVNAHKKILLGKRCTKGLGAGGMPQTGEKAQRRVREI
jgi:Cell division GTPase